jgi:hypothetical protein
MVSVLVAALLFISLASDALTTHLPFNPREYPKKVVSCPAINRAKNTPVDIELRTSVSFFPLWHMGGAILIQMTLRLRRHQSQSRKDVAFLARLAESMGELEISDTRVSGGDRLLVLHALQSSSLPPLRMTITSLHRTFVGLARRHTQVTSNHPAQCPTWLAISCVFWNMLVL